MASQAVRDMGASITRMTKEGRKLTYELKVIQQPERARACGSGAKCKSSQPRSQTALVGRGCEW
jgi:hypothetical protein